MWCLDLIWLTSATATMRETFDLSLSAFDRDRETHSGSTLLFLPLPMRGGSICVVGTLLWHHYRGRRINGCSPGESSEIPTTTFVTVGQRYSHIHRVSQTIFVLQSSLNFESYGRRDSFFIPFKESGTHTERRRKL